jgi:clan AA aspartic protease
VAFAAFEVYPSAMGLAYATLELRNPKEPDLPPLFVRSLADTSAPHLCIPAQVARQLRLQELQRREVVTAEGRNMLCSYVGPVEVSCNGRSCYTGAIVQGDEVLLGAMPMEDMDLIL